MVVEVPNLGDSIVDGTLANVAAPTGSSVNTDDVVAVIDTDKVRRGPLHAPLHQTPVLTAACFRISVCRRFARCLSTSAHPPLAPFSSSLPRRTTPSRSGRRCSRCLRSPAEVRNPRTPPPPAMPPHLRMGPPTAAQHPCPRPRPMATASPASASATESATRSRHRRRHRHPRQRQHPPALSRPAAPAPAPLLWKTWRLRTCHPCLAVHRCVILSSS